MSKNDAEDLGSSRGYAFCRGDLVFEIFSYGLKLYVTQAKVKQSYAYSRRVTTSLEPYQGIKFDSFGQFNQSYRDFEERGNSLHMYRTYTSEARLQQDIDAFKRRFAKRTGVCLGEPEVFVWDA